MPKHPPHPRRQIFPLRVAEICAYYASTTPEMRTIKGAEQAAAAAAKAKGAGKDKAVEMKGQVRA